MELSGAEIVVRCLQDEGVKHVFGYPGGAVLFIYDEIFKQDKFQHILVRHEQAAVHAADAYSRSSNQHRRRTGHQRPGRHQCGDRYRDRVHGFDSDGGADRPGADARHWSGRVPGMRYGRHHAAVRQAQLSGQGRARPGRRDQEGVLHRAKRPAGPGAGRHSEGCDGGALRVRISARSVDALVQAGCQGALRVRSRKRCSCCSRRSGRWSTPAAA